MMTADDWMEDIIIKQASEQANDELRLTKAHLVDTFRPHTNI